MSDLVLLPDGEPVAVPAQTVFAVIRMIINNKKGKEFYENLSKEDMVMISPDLINLAKKFIEEKSVASTSALSVRVQKCGTVTHPHEK